MTECVLHMLLTNRLLASHLIRGARSRLTAPVQASLSAQYPLKPILKSVPFSTWTDRRRATLLQRAFVEGDTKPDDWRAWTDEQAISYSKAARRVLTNHQVIHTAVVLTHISRAVAYVWHGLDDDDDDDDDALMAR